MATLAAEVFATLLFPWFAIAVRGIEGWSLQRSLNPAEWLRMEAREHAALPIAWLRLRFQGDDTWRCLLVRATPLILENVTPLSLVSERRRRTDCAALPPLVRSARHKWAVAEAYSALAPADRRQAHALNRIHRD